MASAVHCGGWSGDVGFAKVFEVKRRRFIQTGLAVGLGTPVFAALRPERVEEAVAVLARATHQGQVTAAVLYVIQGDNWFTRSFGKAKAEQAMFLLGSISKPITVTALMTLYDRAEFGLDDSVKKFIPQFAGGHREEVTMQHLLTHVSGLPDQLAENNELRRRHASLSEFVEQQGLFGVHGEHDRPDATVGALKAAQSIRNLFTPVTRFGSQWLRSCATIHQNQSA